MIITVVTHLYRLTMGQTTVIQPQYLSPSPYINDTPVFLEGHTFEVSEATEKESTKCRLNQCIDNSSLSYEIIRKYTIYSR